MSLDAAIDIIENLEKYTNAEIKHIGVFENFYIAVLKNVMIFLLKKEIAQHLEDLGCYFYFNELPKCIKEHGVNCSGYAVFMDDFAVLVGEKKKCKGDLVIKIPPKEKKVFLDPVQSSLYEILDKATSKVEYRKKIIGILSIARVSPVAHIAMETLRKILKRGEFEVIDEKTIATCWRQKIEFGVRPTFHNVDVVFDLKSFLRDQAKLNIDFTDELSVLKEIFSSITPFIMEVMLEIYEEEKLLFGKCVAVSAPLKNKTITIVLCKHAEKFSNKASFDNPVINVLIALLTNATSIDIYGKELRRDKISVKEIKSLKNEVLDSILNELRTKMMIEDTRLIKLKAGKIKGEGFIAKREDLSLAALSH